MKNMKELYTALLKGETVIHVNKFTANFNKDGELVNGGGFVHDYTFCEPKNWSIKKETSKHIMYRNWFLDEVYNELHYADAHLTLDTDTDITCTCCECTFENIKFLESEIIKEVEV